MTKLKHFANENQTETVLDAGFLTRPAVPWVSVVATNNTTQLVIDIIGNIHGLVYSAESNQTLNEITVFQLYYFKL